MTGILGPALVSRAQGDFVSADRQIVPEMLGTNHLKVSTRFIDPVSSGDEWDRMVAEHPAAHLFHSAAWAKVLVRTYGHRPFYLIATIAGRTVALVPLMEVSSRLTGVRGVCLPFSDFCPQLYFDQKMSKPVLDVLLDLGHARRWKYLKLRGAPTNSAANAAGFYSHLLNLERTESELFQSFSSSVRRALRKAERSPLKTEIATSSEALKKFHHLHCMTRRRHGLPPQPWSFFENIQREIIARDNGFIIVAREGNLAVASAVFFLWKDKALYKFGASDAASQKFRGNNLVIWEAIKHCIRRGVKSLHFGRTDLGHEGLRRFKLAWGTEEGTIQYQCFDFGCDQWRVPVPPMSGFYNRVFRSMPVSFNRLAGSLIYPHLD
jgi:hypothetical protein